MNLELSIFLSYVIVNKRIYTKKCLEVFNLWNRFLHPLDQKTSDLSRSGIASMTGWITHKQKTHCFACTVDFFGLNIGIYQTQFTFSGCRNCKLSLENDGTLACHSHSHSDQLAKTFVALPSVLIMLRTLLTSLEILYLLHYKNVGQW